jgi:hypothetical protein
LALGGVVLPVALAGCTGSPAELAAPEEPEPETESTSDLVDSSDESSETTDELTDEPVDKTVDKWDDQEWNEVLDDAYDAVDAPVEPKARGSD